MKNDRLQQVSVVMGLAALLAGATSCGGGSGGGGGGVGGPLGCAQVAPCGGDVLGSWKLTGGCINTASLNATIKAICPGASASAGAPTISGTVTYNADLTYAAVNVSEGIMLTEVVPLNCTNETSCAAFAQSISDASTTVTCTGSGTCNCTFSAPAMPMSETGTYSTAGTVLSMTPDTTGVPSNNPYCVKGTTLHVMSLDTTMNMGPMGTATIESDIIGQRQ
jgi:hypothetical protein